MRATRDLMKSTFKRRYVDITTPDELATKLGWEPVTFRLQSLSDAERSQRESWHLTESGKQIANRKSLLKASWLVAVLVDEADNRMYTDEEISDVGNMDSALTNWLFDHVLDHVGISIRDAEELEKNSQETVGGDCSPTVSLGECAA